MTTLADLKTHLDTRIPGTADATKMLNAINAALLDLGSVTKYDESLTVVAGQTEYDLPTGVYNLVRVAIANSASTDYDFQPHLSWREVDGKLCFPDQLAYTAGHKIRLYYNQIHDALSDDADTIADTIPVPMIIAIAAYKYYLNEYNDQMNMGVKDADVLNMFREDMYAALQKYQVKRETRDPILGSN